MSDDHMPAPQRSNIPVPDPTVLTTIQTDQKIASLREIIETRMDGADKALVLLQKNHDTIPVMMEKQAEQRDKLNNEKFSGIQRQIDQIGILAKAIEEANKIAIGAALAAQKEAVSIQNANINQAVSKLEGTMAEQSKSNQAITNTKIDSLTANVNTINGRLDKTEGKTTGFSANMAMGVSIVALLASVLIGVAGILVKGGDGGSGNVNRGTAAALTVPAVPVTPR